MSPTTASSTTPHRARTVGGTASSARSWKARTSSTRSRRSRRASAGSIRTCPWKTCSSSGPRWSSAVFLTAMAVFFISDLHLCTSRPDINSLFFEFLRGPAREAESLYILGDLFEYWAGDDDLGDPFNRSVATALAECSRAGPVLRFMHGNRDFLLDGEFAKACGGRLIDDPHTVDLFGMPTLLMHGDTLCTDDLDYQKFRAQVRNPGWQKNFLALPLEQRKRQI